MPRIATTPKPSGGAGPLDTITLGGRTSASGPLEGGARFALTILCHPDVDRIGDRALLPEPSAGQPAPISRTEPVFARAGATDGEPLGDPHLSRVPIFVLASRDAGARLDLGESKTAVVLRDRPVQRRARFSAAEVRRGVVIKLGNRVVLLLHRVTSQTALLGEAGAPGAARELVGESDGLQRVLWQVRNVAELRTPVLLRGETGSGKELVARAIHRASPRQDRPFEAVNLGAVPASLATAELFGTEAGSFTNAVRRAGLCERAHGGTLFLDEIGEAPVELQVALLRFLETGELQTLGVRQVRKVDVRIIAATDADLEAKMAASTFRVALFNRLSGYEIRIPPLRERRDDIGRLLVRFLREQLADVGEEDRLLPPAPNAKPWLPASLVARLADYDWPGNIRQLRNVVQQLVIDNRGRDRIEITTQIDRILAESTGSAAPPEEAPASDAAPLPAPAQPAAGGRRRKVTDEEVYAALRETGWDRAAAARRLGVSRGYLYLPRFRNTTTAEEIIECHRACDGDLTRMAERLQLSDRALAEWVRKLKLE